MLVFFATCRWRERERARWWTGSSHWGDFRQESNAQEKEREKVGEKARVWGAASTLASFFFSEESETEERKAAAKRESPSCLAVRRMKAALARWMDFNPEKRKNLLGISPRSLALPQRIHASVAFPRCFQTGLFFLGGGGGGVVELFWEFISSDAWLV